jgi:hypothetical protein
MIRRSQVGVPYSYPCAHVIPGLGNLGACINTAGMSGTAMADLVRHEACQFRLWTYCALPIPSLA